MAIIHSSKLGWKAGEDVSGKFGAVTKTLKAGDTFVLDDMYQISGRFSLGTDVTLAGGSEGAGFDIRDTATNQDPLIRISDGFTMRDLTITHSNAPENTTSFKRTFVGSNVDDVKIINSSFSGNTGTFFDLNGERLLIQDSMFDGGSYQVRWGSARDFVIDNTVFQNALGDGIKTLATSSGTQRVTVVDSVFLNNKRDGIDTTGGFKDSIVKDSYFVNNGVSGIDVKTIYDSNFPTYNPQLSNSNIKITGSEFINNQNHAVFTTLDRAGNMNRSNAETWSVRDVEISDSVFEAIDRGRHVFLVKDSNDIHWDNIDVLGNLALTGLRNAYDVGLPKDINGTNVTTGAARKSTDASNDFKSYADLAGPDASNAKFFGDGTPTNGEIEQPPVVEVPDLPEPVDVTPPPAPKPDPKPAPKPPVQEKPEPKPEPIKVTPEPEKEVPIIEGKGLLDLYLVDTRYETTLAKVTDGMVIDDDLVDHKNSTFYAAASDDSVKIGSVKIEIDGVGSRIENAAPYALFGDSDGNFFGGTRLENGDYTVKLTVYSGSKGTGEVLERSEVDFTVRDETPTVVTPPKPAPEPAPTPEVEVPVIDGKGILDLYLVDTRYETTLATVTDGMVIDDDLVDHKNSTFYVASDDDSIKIGSVKLEIDGVGSRIENAAPYALFGASTDGNFYGGARLEDGDYTIKLTVYSGRKGTGEVLERSEVDFTVRDEAPTVVTPPKPAPKPEPTPVVDETPEPPVEVDAPDSILDIRMAYTDTDKDVAGLSDGTSIDSSLTDGRKLTIYATSEDGAPAIGSVRIEMDGMSRVENVAPYALFGDDANGDFFSGKTLAEGSHSVKLTAYSDKGGKGKVLETTSFDFSIDSGRSKVSADMASTSPAPAVAGLQLATTASVGEMIMSDSLLLANGGGEIKLATDGLESYVQQAFGSSAGLVDTDGNYQPNEFDFG